MSEERTSTYLSKLQILAAISSNWQLVVHDEDHSPKNKGQYFLISNISRHCF